MDKNVKKGLEFGAGLVYLTVGALAAGADKLAKEGKISRKDSEKLVKDVLKQYQAQGNRYAKQMQSQAAVFMKKNPIATKKDIAELNAKIAQLNKLVKKYTK